MNINSEQDRHYNTQIDCVPEKGWVVVYTELTGQWEHPVFELSILSSERQKLASTLILDAPSSFRITLHPGDVEVGMPLLLQVKLVSTTDMSVETIGEHPFVYEGATK